MGFIQLTNQGRVNNQGSNYKLQLTNLTNQKNALLFEYQKSLNKPEGDDGTQARSPEEIKAELQKTEMQIKQIQAQIDTENSEGLTTENSDKSSGFSGMG